MGFVLSKITTRGTLSVALGAAVCSMAACGANSENASGPPPLARRAANGTYVADYIETQGGAGMLNRDAERATLLTRTAQETANGDRAQRDLRFLISKLQPGMTAGFEISTLGFAALKCGSAALRGRTSRGVAYRFLVYKNPHREKVLYQTIFRSGQPPQALNVPLDGAADIWLVWTPLNSQPQSSAEFTMTAPRFTSGSS